MKRIFNIISASVLALMAAGCVENDLDKNAPVEKGMAILNASIEHGSTKTSLVDAGDRIYKQIWEPGDEVAVIPDDNKEFVRFTLSDGEGTPNGMFVGGRKGSVNVAYYPYENMKGVGDGMLNVYLPYEQEYCEGTFAQGAYPMMGVSSSDVMDFKNLCSVLKVSLKGNDPINSIIFRSASEDVKVAGYATVATDFESVPCLEMDADAVSEVTLMCNGIALNETDATDFYIVLPAQTYTGGFTLEILGPSGVMTKTADGDIVMERSQLRAIPEFVYEPEALVEPSEEFEGEGTQQSPFLINNVSDLLLFRDLVNTQGAEIKGVPAAQACYRQTADISLESACGKLWGSWVPIGDYASDEALMFDGIYDGGGYAITDLYIDKADADYQGLFGMTSANISNLRVSGSVVGHDYVGIVAGGYYVDHYARTGIFNVETEGSVSGRYYVGGISGEFATAEGCVNKASVTGSYAVAGILGVSNTSLTRCVNEGTVTGGSYTGGVSGYHNAGLLFDNVNKGEISGTYNVGGLTGFSRQGGLVINNMNLGSVSGNYKVGGVTGFCSSDSSSRRMTAMMNNLNLGEVTADKEESTGSVCGYNTAISVDNYWLYDPAKMLGMEVGVNNFDGTASNNRSLTELQLKGDINPTPYYKSRDDSYYDLVDALTAWAADSTMVASGYPAFSGWRYSTQTGYPELTMEDAVRPSGGLGLDPVFEILKDRFEVGCYKSEIVVQIKTNMDYTISSVPDWITQKSVTSESFGFSYVFEVSENTVESPREGTIVFCTENQACYPVTVVQEEAEPEMDRWKSRDFWHRSLAMRFTADWCGYCPNMATAVSYAKTLIKDKIEAVGMHPSGGQAFAGTEELAQRFAITGLPSLIVDSRALVQNYGASTASGIIADVHEETENTYPTVTGIAFKSRIEGNEVKANVNIYIKEAGDYKVTVLLLEDDVIAYQNGQGNEYEHDDVARLALSSVSGDAISVEEDYTVWTGSFSGTIPSSVRNRDNLKLLVYVERPYGDQPRVGGADYAVYGNYGDTYVDNCRAEKVGMEAVLQYADDETLGQLYESTDYSMDGVVKTLQKATAGNGIDVVLMGDAYSDRLIADGTYDDVMNTAYEKFFAVEPYASYKDFFNVYSVNVVSKNEVYGGETALEGYFSNGTHVGGNDRTCFNYALKAITEERMDEAIIIVMMNSQLYSGTCYMYYGGEGDWGNGTSVSYFPIGFDDEEFARVLHHEACGHGFSKLADEYAYESNGMITPDEQAYREELEPYGWWKNADFTSDPSEVKWAKFLNDPRYANEGLGVFEGAFTYWRGAWRPTEDSIMRSNTGGFNAPSREAIWYRMHKLAYGPEWEYDYEEFVMYDAVNRSSAAAAVSRRKAANYVEKAYVPTAPPVVTGKTWRDE